MARGHEDFGVQTGGLQPVLSLGELAARLLKGAGGNYRGGNVLYFSVMQNGLSEFLIQVKPGSPANVKLNSKYADYGPACLEVITDNVANAETIVGKDIPINYAGKIGLEVSVMYRNAADSRVNLRLITYDKVGKLNTFTTRVIADGAGTTLSLEYKDSAGNWQSKGTLGRIQLSRSFQSFKMVVDNSSPSTPFYDTFIANGQETDLSGLAAQNTNSGIVYLANTSCEFGHEAIAAVTRTCWLGLFTFTINEP